MTHQNHQTNGASLEDCHTNFFALTELYGIKWRKLVWGETNGGGEGEDGAAPLADPVISSYARCLAGDILCVWRRVAAPQPQDIYEMSAPTPPPLSLRAAKELWIFWYGEEPDLNGLVAPELIASQGDQGSWESGLSYECRSLLFKALHNLIERCLLSRDFVRLGKWFVQPYDGDEEDVGKSPWHLSFSFAFFLHGESTVCASVDVRQHPPVRTLTARRRAAAAAAPPRDRKVILAPFGLEGTITGREWSDKDPATQRLLEAWRQLYPLEHGCGTVEVICSGVRMRYPVPYVLVAELEGGAGADRGGGGGGRPPAHALQAAAAAALTTPAPHQPPEICYADPANDKGEDFLDPTRKTTCTCAKLRRRRPPRPPPFHRRGARHAGPRPRHAPATQPASQPAAAAAPADAAPTLPPRGGATVGGCSPASCGGGSPAQAVSAPPSAGAPPPSPHPAHQPPPSPHITHRSDGGQYVSTALKQSETALGGGASVPTTLHTPAPTPDPPTPAPPSAPSAKMFQGESPPAPAAANSEHPPAELWARPALPPSEARLSPRREHEPAMLYDYSTVQAWLEHPVKRFKTEDSWFREELALGPSGNEDLYSGHEHTKMAERPDRHFLDIKQEKQEQNDDSKEYKNLFTSDGLCPTLKDLEQIFDNSDDAASGDETVRLLQVQTPPDSNKSADESRCGGAGGRCVRAEELSKMFPTPPSLEAHAQPSPGFTLDDARLLHHAPCLAALPPLPALPALPASPLPDPIEDWSYVFKPPTIYKYVGSSKYAPLTTLPSQLLPPVSLPPHAVYRPRWQHSDDHHSTTARVSTGGVKRSASPSNSSETREVRCRVEAPASAGGANNEGTRRTPGAPAEPVTPPARPACPLLVNVLLADTVLNVFRDHNFDSCTLCVCNAGPKVVGNIRGADAATYLQGCGGGAAGAGEGEAADDEPSRCSCGFSAVRNRRLAHRAGLFYEDEMEITGLAEEPGGGGGGGGGGLGDVCGIVLAQCSALDASLPARRSPPPQSAHRRLNDREFADGGIAASRALLAATGSNRAISCAGAVHRWPFIGAMAPRSSRDVVRLMRRLRPLLQDAIQKRCCGARMWDGVTGPLTWRQFHRLAGRGNEDLCEPQPVPSLLVGHDRDWVSLSPYALRHWERLSLEPYSYSRDVAYVVLAADGDALSEPLRLFFRELSTVYEACRLGRHQPITRIARDGIIRTAPTEHTRDASCEDWTGELPPGRLGEYLKAYAEALRTTIVPQLAALTVDRTLFESDTKTHIERPSPSPMRPPTTPDHPPTPSSQSDQEENNTSGGGGGGNPPCSVGGSAWEEEEAGAGALVVYVVEPPAARAQPSRALHALLRLAARAHQRLQHHHPLVKIISLQSIYDSYTGVGANSIRALAFSVFSSSRRLLQHRATGKSLTGFGTAATASVLLESKDEKNRLPYKLYTPAWVLAPARALKEVAETWGQGGGEPCAVLYLSYCLSHDQRWLLAAATDQRGELLDTAAINVHQPLPRSRRRRAMGARRLGLTKLMDFILGVMSQHAQPWRLVVGRLGRIGHGELKGWSWLLSRKNLMRASGVLREICSSCSVLYPAAAPCILSACLVSTEPDSCLRLMADRFTPDERFSQASIQSHLHTPRDVTATHILVFPTSATTQSNQMPFEPPMANGEDNDMNMFLGVEMGDEEMGDDNMTDLLIGDMFTNMWAQGSPRRQDDSRENSPTRQQAPAPSDHNAEQVGTVLQQPLALGYLVSTAPLGHVPAWWWAGAGGAHLRDACPAFLKSALHIHAGGVQCCDDFTSLTQRRDHNAHPLDSQLTTDVLRYVLEGYNALSWLALDANTHDRQSCLPFHVQVLMQLYHTAAALG